jgi:erythromycin esterase
MTEQGLALAVEALRRSAVQMRGVWPRLGFDDLRPLAAIIGDARVVGLGEAAHGAGELFTVKHRLIEYLVVELGFTGVAFEASYAGCQPIDEYVRHGRGVAAEALTGQGYTAWDTDEVSALVEWLRLHNGGVPHDRKVAFYGLDSGYNAVGRRAVLDLVARAAPTHLSAAREVLSSLETLERKWPFRFDEMDEVTFRQAYQGLQDLERTLADKAISDAQSAGRDLAQARRFVRIMAQWAGPDRVDRSRHMGQNLLEIIACERSDAKFIIWQHNRHVGRGTTRLGQPSLGDVLSDRFGDNYRAIAMEFGDGRVHTRRVDTDGHSAGLAALTVPSPPAGSVPWLLSSTGLRSFAIDVRRLNHDPVLDQWLSTAQQEHAIGWTYDPSSLYHEAVIAAQYDAIVFVEHVTPTHPTPNALQTFARRERY